MELRPPEECFHLAASATRLLNSTSYNMENCTYGWTRTTNSVLLFMILKVSTAASARRLPVHIDISSLSELL